MKKIGIIRIDRMGDIILTLPIIKAIKLGDPSTKIHVFCSNRGYKILKYFPYVDKIININKNLKKNKEKYDQLLNLSPSWKSFYLCLFLNSKKKANIILTSRYKNKIFSKKLIFFLSKIFFNNTLLINRIKYFKKNKTIHQTDIMFQLLEECKILFKENIALEKFLPIHKFLDSPKKICLIHLSSKWINKSYNENNFLNLVSQLSNKFNLAFTSDETTSKKFKKIFSLFPIIDNNHFNNFLYLNESTIFKDLNFENWVQVIYSSEMIITPECGCTHIAAICKIPSKIIYDSQNKPEMIYYEYSPWQAKHEKFIFNDKKLNENILSNL